MFLVTREFSFSASHRLPWVIDDPLVRVTGGADRRCMGLHWHDYRVQFILGAYTINPRGEVRDLHTLDPVAEFLALYWDHKHLNDVLITPERTTPEALAGYLWERFEHDLSPDLCIVRVSQNADTWAEYHPDAPEALRAEGFVWPLPYRRRNPT